MRTNYFSLKGCFILLALSLQFFNAKAQTSYSFAYTGSVQTINLPIGIYQIECWGAIGGWHANDPNSLRGKGGYSIGTTTLSSPTTLYIAVGGAGGTQINNTVPGGWNGGGNGKYYTYAFNGGGGASHVATATGVLSALATNTTAVLIVAGGGGGGATGQTPGNGGGLTGGNSTRSGCTGGTQTAPGASSIVGGNASFGQGWAADLSGGSYGAGGGGWYGGGCESGGSSYVGGVSNGATFMFGQPGFVPNPDVTGDGYVIITPLNTPILVTASSSIICVGGGPVTLDASGVNTYTWLPVDNFAGSNSNIITVNPTGTTVYTVQGTDALGLSTSMFTVYVNDPQVNVTVSHPVICAGQSSTLTASGASSYNWVAQSGGFSDINSGTLVVNSNTMPSGVYDVSGTDTASCVAPLQTVTVTVLAPNAAISGANEVCKGNTITLTASGADSYTWNTNSNATSIDVSPLINTTYTLNGSISQDNVTCYSSTTHSVTAHNSPGVTALSNRNVICKGESVVLNAIGSGATSYTWTNGTTNTLSSTWKVFPQSTQNYTITVSNQFNCTANYTIQVKVEQCTDLSENTKNTGVSVYPNPNKGEFTVETAENTRLVIINAIGQVVLEQTTTSNETKISLANFANGIYFVKVGNEIKKIVKE